MRQIKKLAISLAIGLLWVWSASLHAQKDKVWGSWTAVSLNYEFVPRFTFYFELQTRSHAMYNYFNYYEIKGGLGYKINKDFSALVGFGNYGTYDWQDIIGGVKQKNELRIWQQFVIDQMLTRIKFEHRFRIEQAWINRKFRNRFRYRINMVIPLNSKEVKKNTVFLTGFNEIFLTDTPPYFMRNRILLGLGYAATDFLTIQSGWINQFEYSFSNKGAKNYFMLTLAFRLAKNKDGFERNPTLPD